MKKSLLISAILFFFIFTGTQQLVSQTIIGDTLFSDVTLTALGNPYQVTSDLFIPDSVTLTIAKGVKMVFDSTVVVRVEGSLHLMGTATDSIFLTGENGPRGVSIPRSIWTGIMVNGGDIIAHYVYSAHASTFLNLGSTATTQLKHCSMINHIIALEERRGSQTVMDSCHVNFVVEGLLFDSAQVSHTLVENCFLGIGSQKSTFKYMTIRNNRNQGISINGCRMEYCQVYDNEIGIGLEYYGRVKANKDTAFLFNNEIVNNTFGFWIRDIHNDKAVITDNVICNDSMNLSFANVPLIDVRDNCWCSGDRNVIVQKIEWLNTPAPFSPYIFVPFQKDCVPDEVYPGDANHDQVANMRDILSVGQYFGLKGQVRPNASLNWVGQPSPDWGVTQSNGFDIKHVDCNGDSTIDWADTLAINQNYGLTHRSRRSARSNHGIPLILQAPIYTLNPGDTARMPIILGTIDTMANNMYGIAFSIYYDSSQVVPTPSISFNNSWLGTPGTDMITFYYIDTIAQRIDIALARNNQMARSGYGQIAELIVVIDDDIAKRQIPLAIDLADPYAIDEVGAEEEIKIMVENLNVQTSLNQDMASDFAVFPNPTNGFVWIEAEGASPYSVQLFDLTGKQMNSWEHLFGKNRLAVDGLNSGLYLMQINTARGSFFEKVVVGE